jgi:arabinofuranosyltransferase
MSEQRNIGGAVRRYAPLAAIGAVLIWHSLQYNFVTDDAYISFVFSRNFAEHNSLVFNLGDPVEGYTNFLWTFVLGLLMKVGLAPEIMSRLLGTGFALATLVVGFRLVEWIQRERSYWDYLAPTLLALASGYACWSSGGLETQMFTFFIALALYAYCRADNQPRWLRTVGIALALAAMTRPEGLLIAAALGAHRLALNIIRDRRPLPTIEEMWCVLGFLLIWAPWFTWRWWYYGHPFPNTYYVKAAGEVVGADYHSKVVSNGFYYVWQWLNQTNLLYAAPLALAGMLIAKPRTPRFVFGTVAALITALYLTYTIKVGGDFMGLHRFIMPLFFIAAISLALGLTLAVRLLPAGPARKFGAPLVVLALVASFAVSQYRLTTTSLRWGNFKNDHGIDTPAFLAVYTSDRAAIGKHMQSCFREGDFSILGGVGAKPYFARTEGIDVFGLVSWDIAHCQPRNNPRAGHNKWGSHPLLAKQPRRGPHSCAPPRAHGRGYDWSKVDGGPPEFWFSCYSIHSDPKRPGRLCSPHSARDYEKVTLHIGCTDDVHTHHDSDWKAAGPEMQERGKYYTFWKLKRRDFSCKGIVR